MLTLLELKRSRRATAHLLEEEALISWWAEHPVSLPINTSGGTIQRAGGGVRWVIKPAGRPPVKHEPRNKRMREVEWEGEEGRSRSDVASLTMVGGVDASLSVIGTIALSRPPQTSGQSGNAAISLLFKFSAAKNLKQASVYDLRPSLSPSLPLVNSSSGLWTKLCFLFFYSGLIILTTGTRPSDKEPVPLKLDIQTMMT